MSVTEQLTLAWLRVRLPIEEWHLVERARDQEHLACGPVIVGHDVVQTAMVEPTLAICLHDGRTQAHVDLWPTREVCGRVPLCRGCAHVAWQRFSAL